MSRSKLISRYMKDLFSEKDKRNPHRLDEMPKNRPSKFVGSRFGRDKVTWVQEHSTTWGHRPVRNGHSRISGIVRQKVKEEIRKEIQDSL